MEPMQFVTPANVTAALLLLFPYLAVGFFSSSLASRVQALPLGVRLAAPALLCASYILVAFAGGVFSWWWLLLYALLPVLVAVLLWDAGRVDPAQQGNLRDFVVLITLGLAVDLRWFESAWPPHLAIFNKMLLLDAGIYGFIALRHLDGVGFDLRLRLRDAAIGLRELCVYAPIALVLGLSLSFLQLHS